MDGEKKKRLEAINARISDARNDRSRFASRINAIYDFAAPDRMRVNSSNDTPRSPDEQDEIYDEILQDAVEDFASDMVDLFTPKYREWTSFKASNALPANMSNSDKQALNEGLSAYGTALFDAIRNSNFYSVLFDVWVDIAVAVGAVCIPYPRHGSTKVVAHHVPLAELIFEEGPDGIDGRWWEQSVQVRHLTTMLPDVDWTPVFRKNPGAAHENKKIKVIQGAVRDWERTDETVWKWHVIADGELVYETDFVGDGSCPLIVTRWRRSAPSAWGLGAASKALPATRTLNKLSLEILTMVEKMANTPHSYEEDGVQNYEQGIDAGTMVPRMPGSKTPEPLFRPSGEAQIVYFEQEDLRQRVRRALFQDKPIQRGDTPPTLGQWLDEKTTNNRRMENPRDRIVTEGVIPWLQRFAWIESKAGRLPEVKLQGDIVQIEIESPLSKASDMEDVSVTTQTMQIGAGFLGEQFQLILDGRKTMENIKSKLNDKLLELRSEKEIAQILAAQAASVGAPQG